MALLYTETQVDEATRKSLEPSRLSSYLPKASPYTTPTLTAGEDTKLLIPTTAKYVQDFTLDVPNSRWFLDDPTAVNRQFTLTMTTSMTALTNNTVVAVEMWKNGVYEPGVSIDRKISTGADVGALSVTGAFSLSDEDYIEVYINSSLGGTITFIKTAINIIEVN